jgi:hypothetical protein
MKLKTKWIRCRTEKGGVLKIRGAGAVRREKKGREESKSEASSGGGGFGGGLLGWASSVGAKGNGWW